MFSLHSHTNTTHVSTNLHVPEEHAKSNDSAMKNASHPSITAGSAFVSSGASGQPTGLLASLQPTPVKLQGDPSTTYYIKPSQRTDGPHQLYTMSGNGLKQTAKQAVQDGQGQWKLDNGLPGGGQNSSKGGGYQPIADYSRAHSSAQSSPFARDSSRGTQGHSYSNQSAWSNPNTPSTGAPSLPSTSGTSASNAAPPRPPKPGTWEAQAYSPSKGPKLPYSGYGPVPDSRYLTESGDGKSKYWAIPDGHGGSKPADSSIDKFGEPLFINLRTHKGNWIGPHSSITPPAGRGG
ncbi:hypothetical protein ACFFJT_12920 [Dyella flava]|uniref:Uncharacterized protein n=1 Tax=Dyella flava TaxID=1920170 RepID=A0ABS2K6K7_9GAMM|nr:hypothetical protein [Dyella flava]MBM7126831.1 hypothetical protein [Dyella flava]